MTDPTPTTEPTVAVPLSLMQQLRDSVGYLGGPAVAVEPALAAARAVAAVLDQAVPDDEGAAVSIPDMEPGTRFTARTEQGYLSDWTWLGDGRVMSGMGIVRTYPVASNGDRFRESTVRDVTPPPPMSTTPGSGL